MNVPDNLAILQALVKHRVEFVVVGGVAAVLQGAAIMTFDLDIVHERGTANVELLLAALRELDAHYRSRPEMAPSAGHLASPGHQLLMTSCGPLDVLGSVGENRGYSELLPASVVMEIGGLRVMVLDLPAIIRSKEEAGGEKDLAALPLLRRVLSEREKK